MRLTEEVYLIGSGRTGFGLTDPLDCHVYVIDGGDELALIDAGVGRRPERLLDNLRATGLDPARLTKILLTHPHGDHGGGLARLRELTGAQVYVHQEAVDWVRRGDEEKISLPAARAAGIYPAEYQMEPCPVDLAVTAGATVTVGRLQLIAFDTPGHSHGHCSYLLAGRRRRHLLAGDLVFHGGRVVLQNIWDCSIQELYQSLERLADLKIDALLPGHGLLPLTDGQRHIDRALKTMRKLGVPPSLL